MLNNKNIIVTGASSGIGAETSLLLAGYGARILAVGRDSERASAVVERIRACGGTVEFVIADVARSADCERVIESALDNLGGIDGLVNAAGVIHRGDARHTSDDEWQRVMRINVDGVFYMSRAAIAALAAAGDASIVNIGSTVGLVGTAGMPAYCASKGAVIQLTRAMALDHAAQNIRINAVCPGSVDTPMLLSGRQHSPMSRTEVHDMNAREIPQGRIPTPDEVAELIAFLLSDKSRHITGAAIPVDGGYTAQ